MKYTVKIDNRSFEVEIHDLSARPVVALVDGEPVEVWPADPCSDQPATTSMTSPRAAAKPAAASATVQKPNGSMAGNDVLSPLPGVLVEVKVKAGDEVKPGQVLCVIDAMKMKNAIRASRAGTIGAVHAQVGAHVKHHDVLMEFAE